MKYAKKLFAAAMTLAMALALSAVPAFAEPGTGSITINNAVNGHTYTAYQIFSGDYSEGVLSNIDWGDGISAAGKTALQTAYGKTTAADIAAGLQSDADARTFADRVGTNVTGGTAGAFSDGKYTISGLGDGYYMIVDTYTPEEGETGVTYSRYMIQVVGAATVDNKAVKPGVEKKIVEGDNKVENNTANIGDVITYEITSTVPDMTGYKEYYMDFSDTLSKGLTYVTNSLHVYVGDTELNEAAFTPSIGDYSATAGTEISIHLKDLVSRGYTQGATITIRYQATVNDAAVIGNTGNPNTVKLDYSNNPSNSGDGTPDNDDDGVQGETPQETVNTYVTEIDLTKVDGADATKTLAGAVFNVKGSQINKVLVTGEHFVANAEGNYYLLTDNTYTTKAPNDTTKAQYATDVNGNYMRFVKEAYSTVSEQEEANVNFQVVTGADGIIKVAGLKEGTYTFTEIQAPDGYNLLSDSITIVVKSNINDVAAGTGTFEWQTAANASNVTVENGIFKFDVQNNKGNTLPSTGGIGTTILYIIGGIMVLLAGVYLIAKHRMRKSNLE